MNILVALPLLPLLAALWFAVTPRQGRRAEGWVCALVASFPIATAAFVAPEQIGIPYLLTTDLSTLRIDDTARAPLALVGGLWLIAALLNRSRSSGPSAIPLLAGLAGATTVALVESAPALFTGLVVTGYGLYAVMASEPGQAWRRPGRILVVLLVASDLLLFEVILHAAAHPLSGIGAATARVTIVALILRSAIPPSHAWQPLALPAVSPPTALLLVGVPASVALIGGQKLLAGASVEVSGFCLTIGFTGALWAAIGGIAQTRSLPTLGYAAAASAALLLVALPVGTPAGPLPWLIMSLMVSCSAAVVIRLIHPGPMRNAAVTALFALHGLCGGQVALLAAQRLTAGGTFLASLVAVLATMLLTLAVRRTPEHDETVDSAEAGYHALALAALAAIGLGFAWTGASFAIAALWPAPVAISLGLILSRLLAKREQTRIAPGDVTGPIEKACGRSIRLLAHLCREPVPRCRDRLQYGLASLWRVRAWAKRVARLESRLGTWSATSILMMLIAIAGALLLGP